MSNNNPPNSEFVVCVREPDLRNKKHVLIHPILLVSNDNPDAFVTPESVINGFKMLGSFHNRKLISISKTQVNAKNWKLLIEGVKDSEICIEGIKVKAEVLCV